MDPRLAEFNKLVPLRSCRVRNGQIVNARLEALKKKRDRMIKKFKLTKNEAHFDLARALSKMIKKEFKKRITENIQKKANSSNPKTFWALLDQLTGKNRDDNMSIEVDGSLTSDPGILCEKFSEFFIKKVMDLANLEQNPLSDNNIGSKEKLKFTLAGL